MNVKVEKRVYLEDDEEPIELTVRVPASLHKKIVEQAKQRGLSQASFVREALMKATETNPELEKEIDKLLDACTTEDTFEIEDEQGFLHQVSQSKLKGDVWTAKQLDKVAEKLVVGWEHYFIQPDINDLIERFAQAMELSKAQKQYLDRKITEILKQKGYDVEPSKTEESSESETEASEETEETEEIEE
jgi:hypothetical protein